MRATDLLCNEQLSHLTVNIGSRVTAMSLDDFIFTKLVCKFYRKINSKKLINFYFILLKNNADNKQQYFIENNYKHIE